MRRDGQCKATFRLLRLLPGAPTSCVALLLWATKRLLTAPCLLLCGHELGGAARQGWSGTGYFVEDKESLGANPLKSAEQKKLLSAVEKSGLLSRAEKAGLTLSRVRLNVQL